MTRKEAALRYAEQGWPVLPIHSPDGGRCSCGKSDCRSPGKHPRTTHGHNDASVDPEEIERWWEMSPDANVGILTGGVSGIVVLDVDQRDDMDGFQGLGSLLGRATLPATVTVATGGGGKHFYYKAPAGGLRSRPIPGVGDFKADGGYVIAPPSSHASGGEYSFEPGFGPDNIQLAPFPTLLATTFPSSGHPRAQGGDPIQEGRRNVTLASIAGGVRGQGCTVEEIRVLLDTVNRGRCTPPLGDVEVSKIAASIGTYPETRAFFSGGTFWEREVLRSLWDRPDELRLLQFIVSEAAWADVRGALFGRTEGTLETTYRKIASACAWGTNNTRKEWLPSRVLRLLRNLASRGLLRYTATRLGTRIEIVDYKRFKGFSATQYRA